MFTFFLKKKIALRESRALDWRRLCQHHPLAVIGAIAHDLNKVEIDRYEVPFVYFCLKKKHINTNCSNNNKQIQAKHIEKNKKL